MLTHSRVALWRIEYQIDLTRADSEKLPVAYMLEAHWSDDVRWLGMLFRKRLLPPEIGRVDLDTWPEMKDLPQFMNRLFDEAWNRDLTAAKAEAAFDPMLPPALGSSFVASNYTGHSSLRFVAEEPAVELDDEDPAQSFGGLYQRLLGLHGELTPRLLAEVYPFPQQKKPPFIARPLRADVEQVARAA
jgi:hypothetical protein